MGKSKLMKTLLQISIAVTDKASTFIDTYLKTWDSHI